MPRRSIRFFIDILAFLVLLARFFGGRFATVVRWDFLRHGSGVRKRLAASDRRHAAAKLERWTGNDLNCVRCPARLGASDASAHASKNPTRPPPAKPSLHSFWVAGDARAEGVPSCPG